ncbi:unnamed protein product [Acanthoscelides obtectus]|uniref:F-box domain-containing protein n=1 Tax=Acanthoscelides obtectus TaxID=200917 RepID=A0A9P0LUZ5_ACAOB|nr:unnamed protein product [Acanthoscelides obtectus]CAK1675081.1 hypothetical protein AOBTE_LOCUS29888 [Acanthoscelides obtectus]
MADNSEEINDESEHEQNMSGNCIGYYTRSKRRKLDTDGEEVSCFGKASVENRKRKNPIMFVPTEIIQAIFRHLSYQELSTSFNVKFITTGSRS